MMYVLFPRLSRIQIMVVAVDLVVVLKIVQIRVAGRGDARIEISYIVVFCSLNQL